MKKITLLFATSIILIVGCYKEPKQDFKEKLKTLDDIFSDWKGKRPGGAVAIIHKGVVIYEQYFGLANVEKSEPFSKQTISDIGSVSKQFTALCIALLEEDGKLSIEDGIRQFIPELPDYADTVKVKHLLHHTSGIKDYEALVQLKKLFYFDDFMTNQFVLDLAIKQKTLNFEPGSAYEYSNTNYILLAEIIERVSGKSIQAFAKEQIFDPLGMKSTFFNINQGQDFDNRAIGYMPNENNFKRPVYRSHLVGDGGVFTTLSDMIKWDKNFFNNILGQGKASLIERMKYREPLTNGKSNYMGFAQIFTRRYEKESWSHGGGGGGYRTFYERFDEEDFSVIAMSNANNGNPFGKVIQIVDLLLNEDMIRSSENTNSSELPMEEPEFISPTEELVKTFDGYFYDPETLQILEVAFNDQEEQFAITTIDEWKDKFITSLIAPSTLIQKDNRNIQFEWNAQEALLIYKSYNRELGKFLKVKSADNKLTDFVGKYYSDEIAHEIEFTLVEGRLTAENNYFTSLKSLSKDFLVDIESGAIITFKRDEISRVKGFIIDILNGDRKARNIHFSRTNPTSNK